MKVISFNLNRTIIFLVLLSFGLLLSHIGFSQSEENLPDSEVEIIKSFQARLENAEILDIPHTETPFVVDKQYLNEYQLSLQPIEFQYPTSTLKPLAMPVQDNPVPNNFYLHAGYGVQQNPFGEISWRTRMKLLDLNIFGRYESVKGLDNDQKHFQDVEAGILGQYTLSDRVTIKGGLSYLNQIRSVYGPEPITNFGDRPHQFHFSIPKITLGLYRTVPGSSGIHYDLDYQARLMKESQLVNEWNHQFHGKLSKRFYDSDILMGLHAQVELNNFRSQSDNNINTNNSLIGIFSNYGNRQWNVHAGLDLGFTQSENIWLPKFEFLLLLDQMLQPFVRISSGLKQNNLYELTRILPYFNEFDSPAGTESYTTYSFGAKGHGTKGKYEISAGYEISRQKALFSVAEFNHLVQFIPLTTDLNTFRLQALADVHVTDRLTVGGQLIWNLFSGHDDLQHPLHLPAFDWKLNSQYSGLLRNKLTCSASFHAQSGSYFHTTTLGFNKLPAIYLLNIRAEYNVGDHFVFYLGVDNLFDNKSPQFYSLERIGINPKAGLQLIF